MNHQDLFEAIGSADEELLEQSQRRPGIIRKAIICATAVCLVVAIGVGLLLKKPQDTPATAPPVVKINTNIPLGHSVIPRGLTWNVDRSNTIIPSITITGQYMYYSGPAYQFIRAITVEARVLEILPDLYLTPGLSTGDGGYHILRLEILDVIVGDNVPKEIFYRLPENLDPDLTEYDSLILNMAQVGVENYLMINHTQQREETFTLLFGKADYSPEYGAFLAFNDGKLDPSLWKKDGWNYNNWGPTLVSGYNTAHTDCINYPGKLNRDLAQTKQAIMDQQEYMKDKMPPVLTTVITRGYFDVPSAQEVFDHVFSLENGTFNQYFSQSENHGYSLMFTRIINGFSTNEYASVGASIKDGEITKSGDFFGIRFTDTDLENLPDLVSVINNLALYIPEKYQGEQFVEHFCGVSGRYEKQDDGTIIGTVTIEWGNPDYESPKGPSCTISCKIAEITVITVTQDGFVATVTESPYNKLFK